MFVNITWVFFRADTVDDALRILRGLVDFDSIHQLAVNSVPTANLAWGGIFSDRLLEILPAGLVANLAPTLMIAIALLIIRQKNAFELTVRSDFGHAKALAMSTLFCLALYTGVQSKSPVFLYFNF
jgi:hypothetical protein